ncbi:hypothetical protein NDU88_005916 [Pleurodeles waltl]|uniref:Uncharacterized protein n=1 Tax=Pleurodeles waltl TaxID=8319 RepID=A0AAV7NQB7_PLEWA|nr:hypothetical protein NDU88_005916 [Pleurodeles waltl]
MQRPRDSARAVVTVGRDWEGGVSLSPSCRADSLRPQETRLLPESGPAWQSARRSSPSLLLFLSLEDRIPGGSGSLRRTFTLLCDSPRVLLGTELLG